MLNLTSITSIKSLDALRTKTTASKTTAYRLHVNGELRYYIVQDKQPDNGNEVVVNKSGRLTFRRLKPFELTDMPEPQKSEPRELIKSGDKSFGSQVEANRLSDDLSSNQNVWGFRTKQNAFDAEITFIPSTRLGYGDYDSYTLREVNGTGITFLLSYVDGFCMLTTGTEMLKEGVIRHSPGLYMQDNGFIRGETFKAIVGDGTQPLTFGVEGPRVYVKRGGKVVHEMYNLDMLRSGAVLGRSAQFRGLEISLSDRPATKALDAQKDLGFKPGFVKGDIEDNTVRLTSANHGFVVGDLLYITSEEQIWPGPGYDTEADLIKANPPGTYAWVKADGMVRQRYGDGWFKKLHWRDSYIRYVVKGGYRGRVMAVNGAALTMDTKATVAAKGVEVWQDIEERFNQIFAYPPAAQTPGLSIDWGGKEYCTAEVLTVRGRHDVAGLFNNCILRAPKGAPPVQVDVNFCNNFKQARTLKIIGPIGKDGYGWGWRWWPRFVGGNRIAAPDVSDYIAGGGFNLSHCRNANVELDMLNNGRRGLILSNCTGGRGGAWVVNEGPNLTYNGWVNNTTDGTSGFTMTGSVEGPDIYNAFEAYGGADNTFRNIRMVNGIASSNSSVAMVIDGVDATFTENCTPQWMIENGGLSEPVFNFNRNTGRTGDFGGGKLQNADVRFLGPVTPAGDYRRVVVVQEGVNGVLIKNLNVKWPEAAAKGQIKKIAVRSTGTNVMVSGGRAWADNGIEKMIESGDQWQAREVANVSLQHGTVENYEAHSIVVESGVVRNCTAAFIFLGKNARPEKCTGKIINVGWE